MKKVVQYSICVERLAEFLCDWVWREALIDNDTPTWSESTEKRRDAFRREAVDILDGK